MNNPLKMGTMATKSTMKMAKDPAMKMAKDPAMKMAKDPAMNFNTKLKQASADGKLSGEFKEAVDNAPLDKAKTPAKKAKSPAKMAKDPAMKKAALKKGTYADAVKKDPKLPEYIKLQKSLKKGSSDWNKNQNKINMAYGDPTRHGAGASASGGTTRTATTTSMPGTSVERKKTTTKTVTPEGDKTKTRTKTDSEGKVVKQVTKTKDAETGDTTRDVTRSDSTRKTKRKSYREAVKAWRDGGKQGDKPKRKDYMRA